LAVLEDIEPWRCRGHSRSWQCLRISSLGGA
jgi:hypothetical protein